MIIKLLAELLAHTQVTRAQGTLGSGERPWYELRKELNLFGWRTAPEIEMALRQRITECKPFKQL